MLRTVLTAVVALVALAGCASPKFVTSDVTRYHALTESPQGRTFAIVALDDDQETSFAFKQFADQINQRLSALGLKQYGGGGFGLLERRAKKWEPVFRENDATKQQDRASSSIPN
jgi:hypothetical protein